MKIVEFFAWRKYTEDKRTLHPCVPLFVNFFHLSINLRMAEWPNQFLKWVNIVVTILFDNRTGKTSFCPFQEATNN